jgi:hypothetical protein
MLSRLRLRWSLARIFIILGFGIYMVGRIGGPQLPPGTHVSFGDTHGIYLERRDFVPGHRVP